MGFVVTFCKVCIIKVPLNLQLLDYARQLLMQPFTAFLYKIKYYTLAKLSI